MPRVSGLRWKPGLGAPDALNALATVGLTREG